MQLIPIEIPGILVGRFEKGSDNKREDERQRISLLLRRVSPHDTPQIGHLPSGKPILDSAHNISISHTGSYGAIYVTPSSLIPGIDIEMLSDRALRVAPRFMNEQEYEWLMSADEAGRRLLATIIWSAKETAYKIFNPSDASLKRFDAALPFELPSENTLFSFELIYSDSCTGDIHIPVQALCTGEFILTCACHCSHSR
ncbi:4'-phosphopantetheinyl transferase family protein [Porphyromonas gingivalis]|uniref:4'-phosphopantetheinyl transferase family protein n=1 Tax=Porphyromonas gingivalis TaxID=837 RepID=UPI000C174888|nr:4'-phosphopantetheinyl transferase superfamily protein [Porphyromonas gingivalis]ATS00738.1 4'-phosphopantetheinyl transferase [Porphyromonas gingivalis]